MFSTTFNTVETSVQTITTFHSTNVGPMLKRMLKQFKRAFIYRAFMPVAKLGKLEGYKKFLSRNITHDVYRHVHLWGFRITKTVTD